MISLCIPTYNRLSDLKRCLESISKGFDEYPYEVIIADGGSTDGTIEYLKKLNHENVKLIEQGELKGVTKAYNESFKIAKGDYIYIGNDDTFIFPKVFIKACELMDKEEKIGLVAPKDQEQRHGNFFGVTLKLRQYWALLSKFHIFRAKVLKKINYYDDNLKSYYTDDDSCLSVLALGHTIIFTKEVGMIHYRVQDKNVKGARAINWNKHRIKQELEYLQKKWKNLRVSLEEYLCNSPLKRRKSLYCAMICDKTYHSNFFQHLITRGVYDFLLEQSIIFNDKEYLHLNDFYLAQRYPDEIIDKMGKKNG